MILLNTAAAVATGILTTGMAAVGVGTLGHSGATSPPEPRQVQCHAGLNKLPTELRSDLRRARGLPAGQRGKALRAARQKALHGDYGTQAQRWSEQRLEHRARVVARMPQELRTDLKAVRALPVDQRHEARQAVRSEALAGKYGDAVRTWAERVKERRAACAAQWS